MQYANIEIQMFQNVTNNFYLFFKTLNWKSFKSSLFKKHVIKRIVGWKMTIINSCSCEFSLE